MKIINTKVHGVLDYLMGIVLIASPYILNFANGSAAHYVPLALGIAIIILSLLTNYELGLIKTLTMKTHLTMDVLSGVFLAASPWLFSFNEYVYIPHLVLGLFAIAAGLMTDNVPYRGLHNNNPDMRNPTAGVNTP